MTLVRYQQGSLAPLREWISLLPGERKRRAVAAVAAGDRATLWSLLEAQHVRTHGHVSQETLRKYRLGLNAWLDFAQHHAVNLLRPEPEDADLWVRELESAGKKPASVGVLLAGARACYAALRWAKATSIDPFGDVKLKKDGRRPWDKRQPYPEQDLKTLLTQSPLEMRILLRLGGVAGLRASEITALKWIDLELESRALTVQHGKGGKARRVLLPTSLITDLRELEAQRTGLFVIGRTPEAARQRLKSLCRRLDVPYLGLHALRHAAGTRLIRAGFQLQDVAEHLGHSDVQTARTYGKWADDRLRDHLASE